MAVYRLPVLLGCSEFIQFLWLSCALTAIGKGALSLLWFDSSLLLVIVMKCTFLCRTLSLGERGIKKDVVDAQTLLCILSTCEPSQLFLLRFASSSPREVVQKDLIIKPEKLLGFVYPHIFGLSTPNSAPDTTSISYSWDHKPHKSYCFHLTRLVVVLRLPSNLFIKGQKTWHPMKNVIGACNPLLGGRCREQKLEKSIKALFWLENTRGGFFSPIDRLGQKLK